MGTYDEVGSMNSCIHAREGPCMLGLCLCFFLFLCFFWFV